MCGIDDVIDFCKVFTLVDSAEKCFIHITSKQILSVQLHECYHITHKCERIVLDQFIYGRILPHLITKDNC